VYSEA